MCMQFHGFNQNGQRSTDINCVDRSYIRQMAVDASKAPTTETCSPSYVNDVRGNERVKMALQVNSPDPT